MGDLVVNLVGSALAAHVIGTVVHVVGAMMILSRCFPQRATRAVRIARFRLSQPELALFCAVIVSSVMVSPLAGVLSALPLAAVLVLAGLPALPWTKSIVNLIKF